MDIIVIIVCIEKLVQDMRELPWYTLSRILQLKSKLEQRAIALESHKVDKHLFPITFRHIDEFKIGKFQGIALNNTDFDAGDGSMSLSNILDESNQPTLEHYWRLNDTNDDYNDGIDSDCKNKNNDSDDEYIICVICHREYNDDTPGLLCDNDNSHWCHGDCLDMTEEEMKQIEDSGEHWDCPACVEKQYLTSKTAELLEKRNKLLNNNSNNNERFVIIYNYLIFSGVFNPKCIRCWLVACDWFCFFFAVLKVK